MFLVSAVLLGSALAFWPQAQGAAFPGVTTLLINGQQRIRDASSAVPIFGFAMTATGNEALDSIRVNFAGAGFSPGGNADLRELGTDGRWSGVSLYRDNGGVDDALDAGDTPVTLNGIAWAGNDVQMSLSGHNEPLPAAVAGTWQWFIVIRTADVAGSLATGDQIVARIAQDQIVATDGLGFQTQPPADVGGNPNVALTVRLTRTWNMLGGPTWIGPSTVAVNSLAVLGLRVEDGGIAQNRGITDTITQVRVVVLQRAGQISSADFLPLSTSAATSGVALYRDSGTQNDAWDANDQALDATTVSPPNFIPGGAGITFTFSPGLDVPDAVTGAFDFFVVVRSGAIQTGDTFAIGIAPRDVAVQGVLSPGGGADSGLTTPLNDPIVINPSSDIRGDNTPPIMRSERWIEASPFIGARGLDLYFVGTMAAPESATAAGEARDDESGVDRAEFSAEASLSSSPGVQNLGGGGWVPYGRAYGFDATSTGVDSPAVVTVYDNVGNSVSSLQTGRPYNYTSTTQVLLLFANPGWGPVTQPPLWLAPSGTLWFSDLIPTTETATITVDALSVAGGGLANVSASAEPTIGGPMPAFQTFPAGTDLATWTTTYTFDPGSIDEPQPATIDAMDNQGDHASLDFPYREDTVPPSIAITAPAAQSTISGNFVVRATVTDTLTAVDTVDLDLDFLGTWSPMFFDGVSYFFNVPSAGFDDGPHRIEVRATDMVGNVALGALDVIFQNGPLLDGVSPMVSIVAPTGGALVTGDVVVQLDASDNVGLTAVSLSVGGGAPWPAAMNLTTGYYEVAWNTAMTADGTQPLLASASDAAGNLAVSPTVTVRVDNTPPQAGVAAPTSAQFVSGGYDFQVTLFDEVALAQADLVVRNEDLASSVMTVQAAPVNGVQAFSADTLSWMDGNYSATLTASDLVAHQTAATVMFRVDNHAPVLGLVSPMGGAFVSGAVSLRIAEQETFPATLTYSLDGSPSRDLATAWDTSTAADGIHAITVEATDLAGHVTHLDTSVVVDNTAPTVSLAFPGASQRAAGVITFRASVHDVGGIATVTLDLGGSYPMEFNPSTGYYEVQVDTRALKDDEYTAKVTARDASGKTTTSGATTFRVANGDLWGAIVAASPFLLFVFLVVAFLFLIFLARKGTLRHWWKGEKNLREKKPQVQKDAESPPPAAPEVPEIPPPDKPTE